MLADQPATGARFYPVGIADSIVGGSAYEPTPWSLLTELGAFYLDHRRCGELEAGVDGPVVWMTCPCGAKTARRDLAHIDDAPSA